MGHAQSQHPPSESSISASDIETARRAEYVAFLSRHPFATDAHALGFVTGIREDCRLQTDHLRNVSIPLGMLDNDFHRPNLERYLESFRTYEPEIGVIGDAPTPEAAHRFVDAARELKADFPDATLIIVPKCREAINIIGDADVQGTPLVLGYSMGYSDILADDFSEISAWRGQRVHLLGASPPKQWNVIQQLTQPTLAGDPPADIIGLDWNGPHKVAYNGESWSRDGWQRADHLSIRSTVRRSLREMRAYWEERGVWPTSPTLRDRHGPAVREPDDPVWAATGGGIDEPDPLPGPDEWEERVDRDDDETYPLEHAIVVTYEDGRTLAYRSQAERHHVEYYEGLWDSIVDDGVANALP
jgi:hypothetical protein